ncbi:hypothetical protein [Rhizobium sp. BG4]|uniref:hypothetical protein n=1 Tax=Rhizobium sp. BG4 TaxID=2613770 RepID=UPI00193D0551|nr:hypothetical protein [Rhizobium sp. BG4]
MSDAILNGTGPSINSEHYEVERIYRAVADGEPTFEILQLLYDRFGVECNLRPPVAELRLAGRCSRSSRA